MIQQLGVPLELSQAHKENALSLPQELPKPKKPSIYSLHKSQVKTTLRLLNFIAVKSLRMEFSHLRSQVSKLQKAAEERKRDAKAETMGSVMPS